MSQDPYEIQVLDPRLLSFSRGEGGVFQGSIDGKSYEEIMVYRTFPFLYPTKYISIRHTQGEELGVIEDIEELDEESRLEMEKELQFRYFLPQVTKVESCKEKNDLWLWELSTNLGHTRITMRNLHDYMQFPGDNRIILTDMNGKRCEINDWKALDAHSRKQLRDIV